MATNKLSRTAANEAAFSEEMNKLNVFGVHESITDDCYSVEKTEYSTDVYYTLFCTSVLGIEYSVRFNADKEQLTALQNLKDAVTK